MHYEEIEFFWSCMAGSRKSEKMMPEVDSQKHNKCLCVLELTSGFAAKSVAYYVSEIHKLLAKKSITKTVSLFRLSPPPYDFLLFLKL